MKQAFALFIVFLVLPFAHPTLSAQSIHSGTVMGVVKDPSGSIVPAAKVNLRNPVTGYEQNTVADSAGAYRFNNIPQNNYRLTAEAPGFAPTSRTIDVRSSLPVVADISLDLLAKSTALSVTASAGLVETDPSTHQDVDRSAFLKLPTSARSGCAVEPGDYRQQRRCRRGRQRFFSSAGRSRAGELHA